MPSATPGDRHRALDRAQHVDFAEQVGLVAIVIGIALLLTGNNFLVLTLGAARALGRNRAA